MAPADAARPDAPSQLLYLPHLPSAQQRYGGGGNHAADRYGRPKALNIDVVEQLPQNLEEALWAAVDHARQHNEHAIAAELLLILLRHTDRWTPL
jgi:hypothetical protein